MLVPVTFILIRIWGTLRFILYTFAGVHSLNTTYGTVFLYLQVSLLWCAAQCDFFFSTGVVANLTIFCVLILLKCLWRSKSRDTQENWIPVWVLGTREVLSVWPHYPIRGTSIKKNRLPFGFTLSIGNPSINQSMLLIHSQQLNDLLLHLTHDNHFVLT